LEPLGDRILGHNGTEFHEYAALERATGTRFYF
jgi:hypothetical protein